MALKFLCVCLNPTIQRTLLFPSIRLDGVSRATKVRVDASGKGVNVARVLGQSGASAIHLTHLGGRNRDFFLELCAQDSLDIRWADSGSEIRFCTTAIDEGAGTAAELVEESAPVRPGTEKAVLELFESILPGVDALIVSGTKAAGYSDSIIPAMAGRAAARGLLTVLDIKGKDLAACLPHRPAVVKPNLAELVDSGFLGADGAMRREDGALREAAHGLASAWRREWGTELVLTNGSGPIWFEEDGRSAEEPVHPLKALNPTGSGDAFTACLALALAKGASLREAVREGSRAGALNAANLKPGSIE